MERRRYGLGHIVTGLGVLLGICLLPYLISSVYALASILLQVPAPTQWLWGDWLSRIVEPSSTVYKVLVELPICCSGGLALLIAILGVAWILSDREREQAPEVEAQMETDSGSPGEELAEPVPEGEYEPPDVV